MTPHSLISTFVVHCLDSTTPLVVIYEISRLQLASVAEQAGLNLIWSKIQADTFSRDVAHIMLENGPQSHGLQKCNSKYLNTSLGKIHLKSFNFLVF